MNNWNKQRALFDAVTGIDDDLIDEAAAPRMRVFPRRVLRVAAIAAVLALLLTWLLSPGKIKTDENGNIISAPGILRAYACELDDIDEKELEKYELTSDKPFLRAIGSPFVGSAGFGLPLTFQVPEDYFGSAEITFDISSDFEGFCKKQILTNGESIYFKDIPYREIMENIGIEGSFYLDVVIRADGKVTGYGIVSFCIYRACYAYEFKTVCFPLVDGKFQDVSEEYVWQQIEEYKQSKPYGEGYALVHQLYEGR